MRSKDFENKGHVGTYLKRAWNVLETYSECIGKGIAKRRGCEEGREGGGERREERKNIDTRGEGEEGGEERKENNNH